MLTKPDAIDPERDFAPPEEKAIAVAVTMTGGGGAIVMQTYIERDASPGHYNAVLDKLDAAIKRQTAKAELEEEIANLETEERGYKNLISDFQAIETRSQEEWERKGRKGQWKLSPDENAKKGNALTNVERFKDAIAKRKARIAKLKALIGTE